MIGETSASWDVYLRTQFPAYLLPESAAEKLTEEEATRFLAALTGKPSAFTILRNVSFLAPRISDLRGFVDRVRELVRALPSTTEIARRYWVGGFQGKLDLRATTMLHQKGRRTEFVTRTPRRDFDLPENIVMRAVCERLVKLLTDLRLAKTLPDKGWGEGGRECEGALRHALSATALRNVSSRHVDGHDLVAARASRHPTFQEAARWYDDLRVSLDDDDPSRIARTIAEGALLPLEAATRFEIAVVIRLIAEVSGTLAVEEPGQWTHERALIIAGRKDLATLRRDDVAIRFFYNQAELDAGPTDLGVQHYLASNSRMRPDVTVTIQRGAELISALVVECKHSEDKDYLITGFREAMLYRHEYAAVLRGTVKSVLVASGPVFGELRDNDEVIAMSWAHWPSTQVVSSLILSLRPGVGTGKSPQH